MAEVSVDLGEFVDMAGQIQEYVSDINKDVMKALVVSGRLIENDSVRNIRSHQSSGITYQRGGVEHTASTKGNYPNSDKGFLARSIRTVQTHDTVFVGALDSVAPYAEYLEDEDGLDRPFLKPSYNKIEPRMFQLISLAIKGK